MALISPYTSIPASAERYGGGVALPQSWHGGHIGLGFQGLAHGFARLRVERPEVPDSAASQLLLQDREVRSPTAAEVLESARARNAAVSQHQPGLAALGEQLVGDEAVLAALEGRLQQPRRLEPGDLLGPRRAFEAF